MVTTIHVATLRAMLRDDSLKREEREAIDAALSSLEAVAAAYDALDIIASAQRSGITPRLRWSL